MPNRFIEVKFTPRSINSRYYAPILCDVTIKNLSSIPLTISSQGPINPVFLFKAVIIPNDLTGVVRRYEEEIPIYFSDKLSLLPGELYTKTIDVRRYPVLARMFNLNELVTYIDGQFRVNFRLQDTVDSDEFNVTGGRCGIEKSIPQMLVYGLNIRRETDNAIQILDKIKNRIQMNMPVGASDIAVLAHAQNLTEQAFLDTKRYSVDQKTFLPQLQKKARKEFQDFIASSMSVLKESYRYLKSRNEEAARAWLVDVIPDGTGLERLIAEDSSDLVQSAYLMRLILRSGDSLAGHSTASPRQAEGASQTVQSLYKIYRNYYRE